MQLLECPDLLLHAPKAFSEAVPVHGSSVPRWSGSFAAYWRSKLTAAPAR
jgi:hypothetical protein